MFMAIDVRYLEQGLGHWSTLWDILKPGQRQSLRHMVQEFIPKIA